MKNKRAKLKIFHYSFLEKNRKGILMPETLKIILAVIGIGILVFATTSFAGIFVKNTKLKQAEVSLEKIYFAIEKIRNGEKEVEIFLESPDKWLVVTWPQTTKEDKPLKCKGDYCVCICKEKCDNEKESYCKDFLVDVRIEWGVLPIIWIDEPISLKIYKEEEKIIIKRALNEK